MAAVIRQIRLEGLCLRFTGSPHGPGHIYHAVPQAAQDRRIGFYCRCLAELLRQHPQDLPAGQGLGCDLVQRGAAAFTAAASILLSAVLMGVISGYAAAAVPILMVMMSACFARAIGQRPVQHGQDGRFGTAAYAAENIDPGLFQGASGAAADASADHGINTAVSQEARQSFVSLSVGIDDHGRQDPVIVCLKDLELFRFSEVLENLSVIISYRYLHCALFPLLPDSFTQLF